MGGLEILREATNILFAASNIFLVGRFVSIAGIVFMVQA
jgi:hypothetical protein